MNNQNELFLFPAFRLICPMSAIHPLPFSHSKHHSLISQKARCKPSRFFHAQKEESAVPEVILSDYFYDADSEAEGGAGADLPLVPLRGAGAFDPPDPAGWGSIASFNM